MHIILTHEQSDFDAIASLLGAYLVDERKTPVLPRKLNRNVRAFITLYGEELPFVDPRDLTGRAIDEITLVDTQTLVSLKGMEDDVPVHIIDHHPLREDLPNEWLITLSGTGANTTIFVESLRDQNVVLNTIHATLLLLGIYEDTGSLTYNRTTARDLLAASYLIEQGASLQIASDFLNHPLSSAQHDLYERLSKSLDAIDVHGHNIIIAGGDAKDLDEELSTIAHKMRDILDPDALFLVIGTRGGVQLIARSTSDHINVAEIASHFGGGGHERAAASLIKDSRIEEVKDELVHILPEYVKPAITVAEIMSRDPQLLSVDTPVEEALVRMQRFGYEGYPVVDDKKLVGLLTRRAVDRAFTHKLNLTAASLMDAGEYTVRADDSIESLQRLMTETGWGQIPVVDSDNGEIIGIVTRTDLIKTLTPRPRYPSRRNLAERLERALPIHRLNLLHIAAQEAYDQGAALYLVGGFVRDLLMDRPSLDFDLVVEGDAILLAKALTKKYGGRVTSHSRFGTAKWFLPDDWSNRIGVTEVVDQNRADNQNFESLDFVTARTEFYSFPSALPTIERGSIKLDLHRRDFTINTLAMRLDGNHYGELHDYWGGLSDLRQGLVRVLHSLSFVDDPTRMLRAIRFEQRFSFEIELRTQELMKEAVPLLDRVSGDRIRHELDHILVEEHVNLMLERLDELGLLSAIHPKLDWDEWMRKRVNLILSSDLPDDWGFNKQEKTELQRRLIYIIWLLRLSPTVTQKMLLRLKFSASLVKLIRDAQKIWSGVKNLVDLPPSKIVDKLDGIDAVALYATYISSEEDNFRKKLLSYISRWQYITPTVNGFDLQSKGLPPGPIYKEILKSLRDHWLDDKIVTKEQESELLDELIHAKTQ